MLWWWFIFSFLFFCLSPVTYVWYIIILINIYILFKIFVLENLSVKDIATKHVFITGCDTGFGHLLALKLVENGIPTFAGCLTEEGKIELEKKTKWASGKIWLLSVDVSSDKSVAKAAEFVSNKLQGKGLWGLVCNAGIATALGLDDWFNVDDYKKTLEVNTFGLVRTCHAFKSLIKKGKGRIIIMSSVMGRNANPWCGPYVMSKFAVEGYADIIRREGRPFGYTVHILEPSFFRTNLNLETFLKTYESYWDRADDSIKKEYGEDYIEKAKLCIEQTMWLVSSDKVHLVINAYYHSLTSLFPRLRYHIGVDANLLHIPMSFCGTRFGDNVMKVVDRCKYLPTPAACCKNSDKKGR